MFKDVKMSPIFVALALLVVLLVVFSVQAGVTDLVPAPALAQGGTGCEWAMSVGDDAPMLKLEGIRGMGYCEVNLLCDEQGASMFNTTELNTDEDPRNSCPADIWEGVSEEDMAAEFEVPGFWKNGPRGWTVDWIDLPVGDEENFEGLNARWFAYPQYPPGIQDQGITAGAYITSLIARKSQMGFEAGQPVFMLVDPEGTPWVMQAQSMEIDPTMTYEGLFTMHDKLELPPGWDYQVQYLEQELIIQARPDGLAPVTVDSLGNTYDQCNAETCNYVPGKMVLVAGNRSLAEIPSTLTLSGGQFAGGQEFTVNPGDEIEIDMVPEGQYRAIWSAPTEVNGDWVSIGRTFQAVPGSVVSAHIIPEENRIVTEILVDPRVNGLGQTTVRPETLDDPEASPFQAPEGQGLLVAGNRSLVGAPSTLTLSGGQFAGGQEFEIGANQETHIPLEPGEYRADWSSPGQGTIGHDFTVVAGATAVAYVVPETNAMYIELPGQERQVVTVEE